MFRLKKKRAEPWSAPAEASTSDDVWIGLISDPITPGSSDCWSELWHEAGRPVDQERWNEFLGGDMAETREAKWLLGR